MIAIKMDRSIPMFLLSTFILCRGADLSRQVTTVCVQPNTPPENTTTPNLFHTTAVGPHDTLHYVTSSYGYPSILVAKTNNSANMSIDWDHLLSDNVSDAAHSIKFTEKPDYVYGLQFLQLIEYDDTEDKANLSAANINTTHGYTLASATWTNSSVVSDLTDNIIVLEINQNYTDPGSGENVSFISGGSLSFKIKINNETIRAANLPHLQETSNTSHIDVILDHLLPQYDKTRYALEMLYISSHNDSIQLHSHTSIDDEHTPGTFQIVDISPGVTPSSFIQWKPVCYKSQERAMKSATKVAHYGVDNNIDVHTSDQQVRSILYAYYGEDMHTGSDHDVVKVNVSFGLSQDKFYSHTYYTAWSLSLGYGAVPPEEISLLIIVIISVGLGLPVLIIMFGSLGACIHKKKKNDNTTDDSGSYAAIN